MKTNLFQNLILILVFLLSAGQSCSPKPKAEESEQEIISNQKEMAVNSQETTAESEAISMVFPKDIVLLIPVSYRENSEGFGDPKDLDKKEWMELYKDKAGEWKLEPAKIKFSKGFDECVGVNTLVVPANHETTVCYFTPFQFLSEKIKTVAENQLFEPGQKISLPFGQTEFVLNVSGTMKGEELSDFKLDFASGISSVRLLDIKEFDDVRPELIWAGDLNGDSFPDLIISAPTNYEEFQIYFFLSDPKDPKNQLKKVAETFVGFDC